MYGGVRFGGTLPIEDAWDYGFDHVAIAAGAGRPTIIDMKNNLIRGIRKASDFLMALQLTGAFKRDALPNLQARLPAIVIGGGLTAIDTATELMAYYPLQVEKTLLQYETLVAESAKRASGDLRRRRARAARRVPRAWRGRPRRARPGRAAPARRPIRAAGPLVGRRHHRVPQAAGRFARLSSESRGGHQGARGRASRSPRTSIRSRPSPDEPAPWRRWSSSARAQPQSARRRRSTLPARTVLVAAGTSPNITYEKEAAGNVPARREEEVLPAFTGVASNGDGRVPPRAGSERLLHLLQRPTAGSSPTTATTTRATPATSSRRWPRPRMAIRKVVELFAERAGGARSGSAGRTRSRVADALSRLDDEL